MNLKIVTIDRLREFLNKFSKVATSGKYSDLSGTPNLATVATSGKYSDLSGTPNLATVATSGNYSDLNGVPTKVSQFTNDAGYAKITDIPTVTTYTAGEGIKIENGVISVIPRTKVGNPTCPGYTLYGEYFLSNTVTPNKNWSEACNMTENVTVTQNYNYGSAETKTVTAGTLSKAELETLTLEQRKINENGHNWYWTSTPYDDNYAWYVSTNGDFHYIGIYSDNDAGGTRLGFKNPFI